MNSPDKLKQENAALRERISRLNTAILRISGSLDPDTVLNEVVDSARALTGARYGMIATVDEGGAIQELVASGLSADERRHMAGVIARFVSGIALDRGRHPGRAELLRSDSCRIEVERGDRSCIQQRLNASCNLRSGQCGTTPRGKTYLSRFGSGSRPCRR